MEDTDSKKRERSPNFPFIGLKLAIERARQFYDQEKRGSAAVLVIAKHWGYSPKSSGLQQTIAALKSYGLMDDEGRGDARRVRLTDRALRILLDQRMGSLERQAALKQAALSPSLCTLISDRFQHDFPSDDNLEHYLAYELKFNPDSAKAVIEIIKENKVLTEYNVSETTSSSNEPNGDTMTIPVSGLTANVSQPQRTPHAMERIIGPDGEIILQWIGSPSWEAYDFLEDYIKLRKKVLKPGAQGGKQQE